MTSSANAIDSSRFRCDKKRFSPSANRAFRFTVSRDWINMEATVGIGLRAADEG